MKWSSTTGRWPGAFGSHFRRVKRAAARENVGRRSRRQPAVPVLRRAQRLLGSTGLERAVSPTPVAHWRNRGVPTLSPGACPLPTSKSDCNGQGTSRSLERACASSLQHSAWSTCPKRSKSGPQSSPGRRSLSDAPLFPASTDSIATRKSAVRCDRQPAFRATGVTYVRPPDLLVAS